MVDMERSLFVDEHQLEEPAADCNVVVLSLGVWSRHFKVLNRKSSQRKILSIQCRAHPNGYETLVSIALMKWNLFLTRERLGLKMAKCRLPRLI